MKKLLFAVLFGLVVYLPAKADSQLFFLGDGKGYDVAGTQQAMCFLDGSCYKLDGSFLFNRNPVAGAVSTTMSTPTASSNTVSVPDNTFAPVYSTSTPSVWIGPGQTVPTSTPYCLQSTGLCYNPTSK